LNFDDLGDRKPVGSVPIKGRPREINDKTVSSVKDWLKLGRLVRRDQHIHVDESLHASIGMTRVWTFLYSAKTDFL